MQILSLKGKKGVIIGVANDHSIAAGCARALSAAGAEIALTYQSEKAKPHVAKVAADIGAALLMPLDVRQEAEMSALFQTLSEKWGQLDFLIHSIAFCPKDDLHGRVTDCSQDGFALAMDISVHSLIRLVKAAEPLMTAGGTVLTVSYHGADRVVDHYNIMGPVKAALEATVRYLAAEQGANNIRVNALSPGPLETRAASGIDHFDELIDDARQRAPLHRLTNVDEVGAYAAFLVSDGARTVTGNMVLIDGGHHIV